MGDYEVVPNWPRPLPDNDSSHAGWTWGSGAGVLAESPNKVWVSQRGEVELPPGATPWICPCLLTPRRTNTGRRPYSGKGYNYQMRRHHLVFAVDRTATRLRNGCSTTNTWRRRGAPASARWPRPAQAADQSVRSGKAHLDRRRRHARDQHLHQRRQAGEDDGRAGVPGRGPNNFNRPTDIAWLPGRDILRRRRLRRHPRREVRSQREVPHGLGPAAGRSDQPGPERVLVGPQHRHQPRPPAVRRRSRAPPDAGVRRERQVPRDVADRPRLRRPRPHRHRGRLRLGGRLDDGSTGQVRLERPLHPRHRRPRTAARAVRRRPPDQRRSGCGICT